MRHMMLVHHDEGRLARVDRAAPPALMVAIATASMRSRRNAAARLVAAQRPA
jgi:hypothetical protein